MFMSGWSVNLITLFLCRLRPPKLLSGYQYLLHILSSVTDNCPSRVSERRNEAKWPDLVSNPGLLAG